MSLPSSLDSHFDQPLLGFSYHSLLHCLVVLLIFDDSSTKLYVGSVCPNFHVSTLLVLLILRIQSGPSLEEQGLVFLKLNMVEWVLAYHPTIYRLHELLGDFSIQTTKNDCSFL